jgi:hypothetical protein
MQKGKLTALALVSLITMLFTANTTPAFAASTLSPSDFKLKSWSKTIDFFDYVRLYAAQHNQTPPPQDSHAYLYLTYVNASGMQMLYAGLSNITVDQKVLTIPIQTFMMHYKSEQGLKDVIMSTSFMMLLAFNETTNTIFQQSPDKNDTLYASFSLGFNLNETFGDATPPSLNSRTEIIPLTTTDNVTWTWGMKYTNLTALWWKTSIDPNNPRRDPLPIAITRYDELTFVYRLTIDRAKGQATVNVDYTIGKMMDLWVIGWVLFIPVVVHYNATGCYTLKGVKLSNENICSFLRNQGIKMSIVQFQSTVVLDHSAYFSSNGVNVTDHDVFVGNSSISTFTSGNEKIFNADFSSKRPYNLFNYTADPTEKAFTTYNTTTRTCKIAGFAGNPIFQVHTSLMRFIPLVVAHMDPVLYQQAKDHLLDLNYADYFYIIAYPVYSGYRIEHDPTYTAYCSLTQEGQTPPDTTPVFPKEGIIVIIGLAAAVAIVYVIIRRR